MAMILSEPNAAFEAAGIERGDIVLNCFSYHLTPGAFIIESGAHALGCAVIPAGPGLSRADPAGDRAPEDPPLTRARRTI